MCCPLLGIFLVIKVEVCTFYSKDRQPTMKSCQLIKCCATTALDSEGEFLIGNYASFPLHLWSCPTIICTNSTHSKCYTSISYLVHYSQVIHQSNEDYPSIYWANPATLQLYLRWYHRLCDQFIASQYHQHT